MILIIDNYDSFTYNLYQYVGMINTDIKVIRNDKIRVDQIKELDPTHIIISPGPGHPVSAGISVDVVKHFYSEKPILGVCLGHQAIGQAFGGRIIQAKELYHGKSSIINLTPNRLFSGIPERIIGARYHSLVIERKSIPKELEITAYTDDDEIMGIKHKDYDVYGIQFHPESIITEYGMEVIRNFINI